MFGSGMRRQGWDQGTGSWASDNSGLGPGLSCYPLFARSALYGGATFLPSPLAGAAQPELSYCLPKAMQQWQKWEEELMLELRGAEQHPARCSLTKNSPTRSCVCWSEPGLAGPVGIGMARAVPLGMGDAQPHAKCHRGQLWAGSSKLMGWIWPLGHVLPTPGLHQG